MIDGALSQVRKLNPVDHPRRQWPCIYPSPRELLATSQPRPGPLHVPARLLLCEKRAHGAVQPMLRFVINTPARLQLFLSLPAGGPPGVFLQAGGTTTNSLVNSAHEERLGRDLARENILASVMTFQITFLVTMSHSFCATCAGRALSSRSFHGLSRPWPCSVQTATGSPRSPKQIRGRLWETPREQL